MNLEIVGVADHAQMGCAAANGDFVAPLMLTLPQKIV